MSKIIRLLAITLCLFTCLSLFSVITAQDNDNVGNSAETPVTDINDNEAAAGNDSTENDNDLVDNDSVDNDLVDNDLVDNDATGDTEDIVSDEALLVGPQSLLDILQSVADVAETELPASTNLNTVEAIDAFCSSRSQAAIVNRPINLAEETLCNQNGVTFEELLVGSEGMALIVSADNSYLTCMAQTELDTTFRPKPSVGCAQTGHR